MGRGLLEHLFMLGTELYTHWEPLAISACPKVISKTSQPQWKEHLSQTPGTGRTLRESGHRTFMQYG